LSKGDDAVKEMLFYAMLGMMWGLVLGNFVYGVLMGIVTRFVIPQKNSFE